MRYRETVQGVVRALIGLEETLADPTLDAEHRAFGNDAVMRAHDFLIVRQEEMHVERERLLAIEDVQSLALADYISLLLRSYASAGSSVAAVIGQARPQRRTGS